MSKSDCYIGIDTSNYTTSAAVVSRDGEVLLNFKVPLPVKDGERGLRQNDAVYAHVKNQPSAMAALSGVIKEYSLKPTAVGFSESPVNSPDSFMPCFMCGRAFADSFAAGLGIPVYAFSHQEGHIASAVYSATNSLDLLKEPIIAFHVSGGTTDIVLCSPSSPRFRTVRIGGSADLHAGQLIDRVAVMMGIPFPGGPGLERVALRSGNTFENVSVSVKGLECNLSGGENTAKKIYSESGYENAAMYTLTFIAKTLDKLSENLRKIHPELPIVYSGGVMSNGYIKDVLKKRLNTYFAQPALSADNGVGVALLARYRSLSLGR